MNRTKIEWTDYTANPIKGKCKTGCSYCYARKMYDRFKWDPKVRFVPEELAKISKLRKPSKIFICSTHEMFGDWIPGCWILDILSACLELPRHTFQILTKNPRRLRFFSFPDNVWLGVTITSPSDWFRVPFLLRSNAKIKFISFEPLLKDVFASSQLGLFHGFQYIDWLIIGAQTKPTVLPKPAWVYRIIDKARHEGIPLFLKPNLHWPGDPIQEFPMVIK